MDIVLTKEADALICLLYKQYLEKRKNGLSRQKAKDFGSPINIHQSIVPKWNFEDVDDVCRELERVDLINILNKTLDGNCQVELSDNGIVYMENRFKNNVNEVLEHLGKIKDLISFI